MKVHETEGIPQATGDQNCHGNINRVVDADDVCGIGGSEVTELYAYCMAVHSNAFEEMVRQQTVRGR
ncbi:hypothetical protein E2C01_021715 [Portunus trituberculatus]|uniref:Uncharacterized protein n=1 Tax=Portunus trituberculatus TaxID=210409 RepID=A0A5B7E514_PORTR|nr:hypothetical protein [Portunus trituberculatus]